MKSKLILSALFSACCAVMSSCGNTSTEVSGHEAHSDHHAADEIVMTPDDAAKFGVRTARVGRGRMSGVIRVSGQIEPGASGVAAASSPTAGIVTLAASTRAGATVRAGQQLGGISAKSISGGSSDEAQRVAVDAARREVDRLKPLLDEGIATRREYDAAVAAMTAARAAYSPAAASGAVTAPATGVITKVNVASGQYVEAGTMIAEISAGGAVRLRADVPESYRADVGRIAGCNFRAAYADEWVDGDSVGVSVDAATGTIPAQSGYIPVYFTLGNAECFAPGTYVDVALKLDDAEPVIAIPNSAISEQQGSYFVYVRHSDHAYEKRKISIGDSDGLMTQVSGGLSEGEEIVVEGTTMVRLAETSGAVPEGHTHNH